jgi:hypothetical protein
MLSRTWLAETRQIMCIGLVAQSGSSRSRHHWISTEKSLQFRLGVVITPSGVFQSEVDVHRLAEVLLAAEIAISCLNRWVCKKKLNMLKFSARQMA